MSGHLCSGGPACHHIGNPRRQEHYVSDPVANASYRSAGAATGPAFWCDPRRADCHHEPPHLTPGPVVRVSPGALASATAIGTARARRAARRAAGEPVLALAARSRGGLAGWAGLRMSLAELDAHSPTPAARAAHISALATALGLDPGDALRRFGGSARLALARSPAGPSVRGRI